MANISFGFYISYYDTARFFCVAFVTEPISIHKVLKCLVIYEYNCGSLFSLILSQLVCLFACLSLCSCVSLYYLPFSQDSPPPPPRLLPRPSRRGGGEGGGGAGAERIRLQLVYIPHTDRKKVNTIQSIIDIQCKSSKRTLFRFCLRGVLTALLLADSVRHV